MDKYFFILFLVRKELSLTFNALLGHFVGIQSSSKSFRAWWRLASMLGV